VANLTLEHLTCEFRTRAGALRAVDDVCLDAADGELIVLVGPSGSGKSTTLRLIAGLENPTSGEIRIGGQTMNSIAPRGRDVAMVFQNYALYPHMNVFKNLAFGLNMRGVPGPQIEQSVGQVAAKLGLSSLLHRKPHQLSGGEKQRVALGRAIVRRPRLFLLDEPLSNLDISMRAGARIEIKRIQRELAATMVYVTHDQEEAMTLADRIVVLKTGRIQQIGAPLEIYNRPANRFVAGFFGSPSMNLITGEIRIECGCTVFRSGSVQIPIAPACWSQSLGSDEVVLGIRPHEVRLTPIADGLPATIRTIEPLGDSLIVRAALSDMREIVVKAPAGASMKVGDRIGLDLPSKLCQFFASTDDGRTLN